MMPSTKSVRLDPVQSFKVEKPSTVVRSLSSQSSSDAFVASRGFLLAQSDVTAACLRVANNRHWSARTEDAEHCAYRLRCMMSQLRSARVDKILPPSKYDLLRGVMMMAHITAPLSQWQRSKSKKTDNDIAFDARTPAPEKSSCSVLVTVSDEELD